MGKVWLYFLYFSEQHVSSVRRDRTLLGKILFCWEWLLIPFFWVICFLMALDYATIKDGVEPYGFAKWNEAGRGRHE